MVKEQRRPRVADKLTAGNQYVDYSWGEFLKVARGRPPRHTTQVKYGGLHIVVQVAHLKVKTILSEERNDMCCAAFDLRCGELTIIPH